MPAALIEIRRSYPAEHEAALIDAVHAALMEGLRIPEWDRNIRLINHEPHRFAIPAGKSDRYTLISIDLFAGRSIDAKRRLYKAIINNLASLGIPADHILILLRESPRENWGVRGGLPASEIDLGFDVNV